MRRFSLLFVLPTVALMSLATLPLMLGEQTLHYRDVLNSHYPLKAAHAQLMQAGSWLPLIDPYRAGGQPLLGNPNVLPLYPSNVLYLVASPLWALNAHFWLHWLLAPFACAWLGRALGLSRPASWAAAATYALSGFFLSTLNLYNMVAGVALVPALIAAALEAGAGRRRGWPLFGGLWALLILAGDPMTALLGLGLALTALPLARRRADARQGVSWRQLAAGGAAALALGSLVAAPMIVEMLRILPLSYRGYWRFEIGTALAQSWHPATIAEWFVPFFFGDFDNSFWGLRFYGGNPPLIYCLYAGTLTLALILVSGGWRRGPRRWAWLWLAGGLFAALGAYNPIMRWAYHLPGMSTLRYPVKLWLVVAVAMAVLAGFGFERALDTGAARLRRVLGLFSLGYLGLWLLFLVFPAPLSASLQALEPQLLNGALFEVQRLRWLTSLFFVLLTAVGLWIAACRLTTSPSRAGAWLVAIHVASQLLLLQPLFRGDDAEPYLEASSVEAYVADDEHLVHGAFDNMFGRLKAEVLNAYPDASYYWLTRESFDAYGHFAGVPDGRVYELNHSPEGLDSFFTISLARLLGSLDDADSVRLLAASGVDALLLHRPLEPADSAHPGPRDDEVTLRYHGPGQAYERLVYGLDRAMADYQLVGRAQRAAHLNGTVERLTDPDFDPRTMAVVRDRDLPADLEQAGGTVRVLDEDTEGFAVQVDSQAGGVLTTRRAWLPIYRAWIDQQPASLAVVNLHKIGVVVPAGSHRVEMRTDRRPTYTAATVAVVAALLLLMWLAWAWRGRSKPPTLATRASP